MSLDGARILIVDDNVGLAENVAEILETEGAKTRHARTGRSALEAAEAAPFDVALLDVGLPDVTGTTVLPELRRLGQGAEVLLITGNASLEDAIEAVAGGAYAYVLKPFDPAALVAEVARALRQVRSTRESEDLRQALERSETGLRTLVHTVQALLLVLDATGRVVQANQAAADATGVSVDDLVGTSWFDRFVPEDDQSELRGAFQAVLEGAPSSTVESRVLHLRADGGTEIRWVRWRASALEVEGGQPCVYASGLDMTDVRELERRTRVTEKLAAVGTLSAGLAHEIRNPLNAASLQLRVLSRRLEKRAGARPGGGEADGAPPDPSLLEPVSRVQAELGRLSRLVGDFLQFARPTGLVRSPVDLVTLVREVLALETPAAEEKGADLFGHLPEGAITVEGDAEKLRQVVLNLIRNAVEAAGTDGRVEVGVSASEGGASLWVADDGPGIPEADLSRIFEPFYSTKTGGTGLGMAIVHSLVTLHGGEIDIDSEAPGTRVTIRLPAVPP
jgi:PAS domain S-box-containing protein